MCYFISGWVVHLQMLTSYCVVHFLVCLFLVWLGITALFLCRCVCAVVSNASVFVLRSTCQGWGRSACRTSMSASRSKRDSEGRRYGPPLSGSESTFSVSPHFSLTFCLAALVGVFQYDSDGSDSQESSEEAELRRKKIEALKVSLSHSLQYVAGWWWRAIKANTWIVK